MGQVAEDMINGTCCSVCGSLFVEKKDPNVLFEHGYPVACNICYDPHCGYQKQDKQATTI